MQPGPINLLPAAPPQAPAAAGNDSKAPSSDAFSKLLGDATAQRDGNQNNAASLPAEKATPLVAQEIDAAATAPVALNIPQLLNRPIGPEEAKALLSQMDSLQASVDGDPLEGEAFDQLHAALEEIEAGGEPTELGDILDNLPAMADAETPEQHAPIMQRMMAWVQTALDKHKEAPTQAATVPGNEPDGLVQSLQASLFPAGDAATAVTVAQTQEPAAEKTADETNQSAVAPTTVTQIVPLMQHLEMPAWVRKLGAEEGDASLDAAIPPLAIAGDDKTLPKVNLPNAHGAEKTAAQAAADPALDLPSFGEHLRALPGSEQEAATAPVTQPQLTGLHGVGTQPTVSSLHSTTHAHAAAMTTTHLPASEQVQVAITRAMEDGTDRITLQLDPADLGRVEVKMELSADGRTQVSFLVDKAETLDMLARDARSLERSLQEAGLKTDAGGMEFNLRQQPQFTDNDADKNGGNAGAGASTAGAEEEASLRNVGSVTHNYIVNIREGVDIHA